MSDREVQRHSCCRWELRPGKQEMQGLHASGGLTRRMVARPFTTAFVPALIRFVFGMTFAWGVAVPVGAVAGSIGQRIDPDTFRCEDFLPAGTAGQSSWQDMMEVEHCDRIKRLKALARTGAQPEFHVIRIPGNKLPPGFPASMPMLRVVFPQRAFFDTAESDLRPEGMDVVRIVAESLRNDVPDVALFVAGHTDARGNREYNQNLSVDRANAVAAEILQLGVNLATVWRIGFGPDMPLVPNDGPLGWSYNRRVEFLFASRPEAIAVWLADMQLDGLCSGSSRRETDQCKHALKLRSHYEAVQLLAPSGTAISADSRSKTIGPRSSRGVKIQPVSGRTFVINPVNRTARITSPGNAK